jgi:hypothetical protein
MYTFTCSNNHLKITWETEDKRGFCFVCSAKGVEVTPSAPDNSDYAAALRVMRSFLDTGAKFSIDCDFGDFEMYCRERLHSEEPNVA